MTQEPLFELGASVPLPRPAHPLVGVGPIVYADYRPKWPAHCQDCDQVSLEANRAEVRAPLARQARHKRTQGGLKLFLCTEHKQARQNDEAK